MSRGSSLRSTPSSSSVAGRSLTDQQQQTISTAQQNSGGNTTTNCLTPARRRSSGSRSVRRPSSLSQANRMGAARSQQLLATYAVSPASSSSVNFTNQTTHPRLHSFCHTATLIARQTHANFDPRCVPLAIRSVPPLPLLQVPPKSALHSRRASSLSSSIATTKFVDVVQTVNNNIKNSSGLHGVKRETSRDNMKSVLENTNVKTDKLNADEEELLYAAEHGLASQVAAIVERQHHHAAHAGHLATLVANCQDFMGRTPIMLAAVNEHFDCIDYLVRKSSPQRVLEALLACIEQDLSEVSQYIIKHPVYEVDKIGARIITGESGDIFYDRSGEDSLQYSSDITPVILAAQKQQVETLKLLLDRRVRIERPHKITCSCTECHNRAQYDSLKHSRSRLNAYRGLTSPSYIALTARDPITEAFRLSGELRLLSDIEKEFKAQYVELSQQCEKFAVELLDHCRNTQEVRIVLRGQVSAPAAAAVAVDSALQAENGTEAFVAKNQLALLNLAFRYNQKSFVAHASCQQQVGIFWCNGMSSWRRRAWLYRAAIIFGTFLMFPIIMLLYMLVGGWQSPVRHLSRMPLIKFVMSIASDLYFVGILIVLGWTSLRLDDRRVFCDQPLLMLSSPMMLSRGLLVLWVLGQLANVIRRFRHKSYLVGSWNYIELATCLALLLGNCIRFADTLQLWWFQSESCVTLNQLSLFGRQIYNCLLALASILTFVRVTMTLFQASESFGPLQISLGRLVPEIAKYIFVFVILMTSFNIALMMIYREYPVNNVVVQDDLFASVQQYNANIVDASGAVVPNTYQVVIGTTHHTEWISDEFSTISGTFQSLFWSLFGMSPREAAELRKRHDFVQNSPYPVLAEYSGNFLFGSFHVLSIILINILIAALAWGYTEIREDEDTEWKYARTRLRLSYIEQKNFTQPPFNLLPSVVFLIKVLKFFACSGPASLLKSMRQLLCMPCRRRGNVDVEFFASNSKRGAAQFNNKNSAENRKQSRKDRQHIHTSVVAGDKTNHNNKSALLAALTLRKQLDNNRNSGDVSPYERLMISLTTRWMHYKFYKHAPAIQQQPQHAQFTTPLPTNAQDAPQKNPSRSRRNSRDITSLRDKIEQAVAGIEALRSTVTTLMTGKGYCIDEEEAKEEVNVQVSGQRPVPIVHIQQQTFDHEDENSLTEYPPAFELNERLQSVLGRRCVSNQSFSMSEPVFRQNNNSEEASIFTHNGEQLNRAFINDEEGEETTTL